ncbi:MAG: response regulator [Verrucomicrobiales bacterium]|nr:response regulator [Verrucomicrobiales bacterium]
MTKVLIVDDNQANLYQLESLFRARQWTVQSAPNGTRALALARSTRPNLIISEILMPVMDGFTLCREWQKDPVLREVPFVFCTATYTDPKDMDYGLALGAADYLLRPDDPRRLLERFDEILGVWQQGRPMPPPQVVAEEDHVLQEYNQALVRKLERRRAELESTYRRLADDVEERRRVEGRLKEESRLLDFVQDAVLVLSFDGVVSFWNRRSAQLFGWSATEAIGARFAELAGIEGGVMDGALRMVCDAGSWTRDLEVATASRRKVVVSTRWQLLRDDGHRPTGILILAMDSTERRQLETQLYQARRLEAIGMLASGIAHELNNILTPIVMGVPMLRWEQSRAEFERVLGSIEAGSRRVAQVIRPLLAFGTRKPDARGTLALRPLIRDVARILEESSPQGIQVACDLPANLGSSLGDANQIRQVLLDLCFNAREAMTSGGKLTLSATNTEVGADEIEANPDARSGSFVRITIEDTGAGIAAENLDRIFDPQFTTKDRGGGAGLGLATVLAIVRRHGGFLDVDSQVGRGSRFVVFLPACAEVEESVAPPIPSPEDSSGVGELILVVDDEPEVRQFGQRTLERYGYRVLLAADGAEAMTQFARNRGQVRLVITDITMPVMDGVLMAQALRRLDPKVPILVWSGMGDEGRKADLRPYAIARFLRKPVPPADLLTSVARTLRGPVT